MKGILALLMMAVLGTGCGNADANPNELVELTDEQIVRYYLNDEYGEAEYEIIIDETFSYNYLIAYRAYEDGLLEYGGAINRDHYKNIYTNR